MMHLFAGAVLAIRNPGGHAFPEGSEQRAIEYISLLSPLAYRVQEAKLRKNP
ncbi:MAG: TIGR02391 family protein [Candidatus Acidiferrum sp.]